MPDRLSGSHDLLKRFKECIGRWFLSGEERRTGFAKMNRLYGADVLRENAVHRPLRLQTYFGLKNDLGQRLQSLQRVDLTKQKYDALQDASVTLMVFSCFKDVTMAL